MQCVPAPPPALPWRNMGWCTPGLPRQVRRHPGALGGGIVLGGGPGTSWKHSKFQVGGGLRPSWSLGWLGLRAVTLTVTSKPRLCPPAPGVGGLVRGPGLKGSKPTGGSQAWALWASSGGLGGLGCSRSPDRGPWGPGSRSIVTSQGRSGLLDSSGLHLTATTLDLASPGPLL